MIEQTPAPDGLRDVSLLLKRWSAGDQGCLAEMMPLVEAEIRRIAHRYMSKEREGHTLQTTALVNEAYLKLVDQSPAPTGRSELSSTRLPPASCAASLWITPAATCV